MFIVRVLATLHALVPRWLYPGRRQKTLRASTCSRACSRNRSLQALRSATDKGQAMAARNSTAPGRYPHLQLQWSSLLRFAFTAVTTGCQQHNDLVTLTAGHVVVLFHCRNQVATDGVSKMSELGVAAWNRRVQRCVRLVRSQIPDVCDATCSATSRRHALDQQAIVGAVHAANGVLMQQPDSACLTVSTRH